MAIPRNFIYQKPTDNVADAGVVAVNTGAADATYPASYLTDKNPARPAKLTGTTGSWVWTFAAPQRLDLVALIHHNLTAGLDVKIQGNATNVWGAPTLSQAITIPAYRGDFPTNPWLDLATAIPLAANRTFQF